MLEEYELHLLQRRWIEKLSLKGENFLETFLLLPQLKRVVMKEILYRYF